MAPFTFAMWLKKTLRLECSSLVSQEQWNAKSLLPPLFRVIKIIYPTKGGKSYYRVVFPCVQLHSFSVQ